MEQHEKLAQELHLARARNIDEEWVCDLEQNPDTMVRAGPVMPTLITHGMMWGLKANRPMLAPEHLAVQGHLLQDLLLRNKKTTGPYAVNKKLPVGGLSEAQMKSLAGNGQHLAAMGTFVLWCNAFLEDRSNSNLLPLWLGLPISSGGNRHKQRLRHGAMEVDGEGGDNFDLTKDPAS